MRTRRTCPFATRELKPVNYVLGWEEMGSSGRRETAFARPRVVIAEGETKHDRQPKNRAHDNKMGAPGTVARMHEVENHQRGLDRGNGESDDNIEFSKVLECGPDGDASAEHQGREYNGINFRRNDMLGHAILSQTPLAVPVNQI